MGDRVVLKVRMGERHGLQEGQLAAVTEIVGDHHDLIGVHKDPCSCCLHKDPRSCCLY